MNEHGLRKSFSSTLRRGAQRLTNWIRPKTLYAQQAERLAQDLMTDVRQFDEAQENELKEKILEFGNQRGYEAGFWEKWKAHRFRILLSAAWIESVLNLREGQGRLEALDLGAEGLASDYWRFHFPQVSWENTNFDLRLPWKIAPASKDLIVATEVIEHLSDLASDDYNDGFYQVGAVKMLQQAYLALKPGGYLFLTTPNAASVHHLWAVLHGEPPWFFDQHVREYTLPEIVFLLSSQGFEIVRKQTIHCMSAEVARDYAPIFQLLLENHLPITDRSDDQFILARKPLSENGLNHFVDVPASHFAWQAVEALYTRGIVQGGGVTFSPDAPLTRAQLAVLVEKSVHGADFMPLDAPATFDDTAGHWARKWAEAFRQDGLADDLGGNGFQPDKPVTRADAAVFLLKVRRGLAYQPPVLGHKTGFSDVPFRHPRAAWIQELTVEGIIDSVQPGLYRPDVPVTRAEMAVWLEKALNI